MNRREFLGACAAAVASAFLPVQEEMYSFVIHADPDFNGFVPVSDYEGELMPAEVGSWQNIRFMLN